MTRIVRNILAAKLVVPAILLCAMMASAQVPGDTVSAQTRPTVDQSRVGVDSTEQLSITLEQAIEMALKNNNDIESSRSDVKIADLNIKGARGVYDPLINSQGFYESRTTPTASTIGGAVNGRVTQRQVFADLGLTGFVPKFGGSYDAVFTSARTDSTNRNATLNPQYPTSLVLTYVQPLFRNFKFDNNRRQIEIAKKNREISDSTLKLKAITVVSSVEQAYWNLAFAMRNLQIQNDTLKQSREQMESNKRLVEKGVLAPIEIVAANAQIANFEQSVFLAQETVTRAENSLKTLLLPDRAAAEWSRPITPTSPVTQRVPQTSVEIAVSEAIMNRPEVEQLGKDEEINKIDLRYFRNQTKPQIDLVGSYTTSGLAGTPNPLSSGAATVPDNLKGGYFTSLGNLAQQDFPTYRVGVQISLPWGNNVAEANLGRTLVEAEKLKNTRAQTEQLIEAEVRNAIQALRSAESRLASATAARVAAEELYSSEQRQFRAGVTTFYLVAQRQTELLGARGRELQAQTDLNIAISIFYRAVGRTLAVNNVTVTK